MKKRKKYYFQNIMNIFIEPKFTIKKLVIIIIIIFLLALILCDASKIYIEILNYIFLHK